MKRLLAVLIGLALMEGAAWWWTHPAPAGLGEPVLAYERGGRRTADAMGGERTVLLPAVVEQAAPGLRCSRGIAARVDREDGAEVHLAFFEWDFVDVGSVFEAFKHRPEECLGAIGMTLLEVRKPRVLEVGDERLSFEHTVFRDPSGMIVHAFKSTWVSGLRALIGEEVRGGGAQWRTLRWRAALARFRPAYTRVAQGAVRGISNDDLAWAAFQKAIGGGLEFH
jgi:hypothetical protein